MQKLRAQGSRYSSLFADTEFVPSQMNYLTLIDRQSSKLPTVLPIDDETITLEEIENQISMIHSKGGSSILLDLPEHSSIHEKISVPSLRTLKCKYGRKKINGQEVEYSSLSGAVDIKKIMENLQKCPQSQGQKCKICCIMIGKKQDVIHAQFKWRSQKEAISNILKAVNQNYGSKLTENDITWYGVTFERTKQDQVTFFKLRTQKHTSLQNYIFQSDSISFVGIEIIVNRFSFQKANQKMKVQRSISNFDPQHSENIVRIKISNDLVYNLEYQYYKNYQIQELLSILKLQNPQSKGLKVRGVKYSPYNYIYCLGEYFKQELKVHHIETELTTPEEILMKQVEKYPLLTPEELKVIEEQSNEGQTIIQKPRKTSNISALRLFCSDCNYRSKNSISKIYHIISHFLKNYQYHYIYYFDASISARFTKTLRQQILKRQVYKGTVFRRLGYELKCVVGDLLEFNNFVVCSKNKSIAFSDKYSNAWQGNSTYITLQSETGRIVGGESNFQGLQQIIFLPYRRFQVLQIKKNIRERSTDIRLREYVEEEQTAPLGRSSNILLWIDDKLKQGKKVIDYLLKQKVQMQSFQLTSTEQFRGWIHQNARFLQQQHCNVVIITNMSRSENNKFNEYAGTDAIRLAQEELPYTSIILYIGDLHRAHSKLKEKSIDPTSIFVTHEHQKMIRYLIDKLRQKPVEKRQTRGIESIQKQNWQDYFSILDTSKNVEQIEAAQMVIPNIPKTIKYTQSEILKSQKQQAKLFPSKLPTASKQYVSEEGKAKKQEKPQLKKVVSPAKVSKSSIYVQTQPQKPGFAGQKAKKSYIT